MSEYAFPRDLLDAIKSRWQATPGQQFELPDIGTLQRLLETCYHASLRTSEQRVVKFVVAYISSTDVPEGALRLTNPVPLTDSELVRMSPVTQHQRTVIGCEQTDGWLSIWGFFDYGHAWVQHSAGDPPAVAIQVTDFPPDCLTITIDGPGVLIISQGRTSLVRLCDGRVVFPQEYLLEMKENPLGGFFYHLIDDLLLAARPRSLSAAETRHGHRTMLNIYTTSILAILKRIRLTQHGGSVVISRVPFDRQLAHMTYTVSAHGDLLEEIMAYKTLYDSLSEPLSGCDATAAELKRCQAELDLNRLSQKLIRGISRISLLAAVDGAVLLDEHLQILNSSSFAAVR